MTNLKTIFEELKKEYCMLQEQEEGHGGCPTYDKEATTPCNHCHIINEAFNKAKDEAMIDICWKGKKVIPIGGEE